MSSSALVLEGLADLAIEAARRAGAFIEGAGPLQVEHKEVGQSAASQVVTEVDRRSQDIILEVLRPSIEQHGFAVLSEELEDDGQRLHRDYFWCIDPLDGTLPFIEGKPGYAVSIGLVSRDGASVLGVVFDPNEGILYHGVAGRGVFRNERPWTPLAAEPAGQLSLFVDRSFSAMESFESMLDRLERVAQARGLEGVHVREPRASVMNACGVLNAPPACYFKLPKPQEGGGSLWDYAATACLFQEAGGVVSDIHGRPLELNRSDTTFMNHCGVLFATDAQLAGQIRALVQDWL